MSVEQIDLPVFLVHGFHSDSAAMNDFAKILKSDFKPIFVELPLSFNSLESALLRLKQIILEYLRKNNVTELYFIGYSTGGIIIRMLMNDKRFSSITKVCLFVAVPNKGTVLAEFSKVLHPIIQEIYLPIKDLTPKAINKLFLLKPKDVTYGGIAGSHKMELTDSFFDSPNDGIVSVKSVFLKEMNDFVVLPYNHSEIHHHFTTCILAKYFLINEVFPKKIKEVNNMDIGEKFITIIENGYTNELCNQLRGNIDFATAGGKVWWNEIGSCNGWRLQQNKITQHLRILNPDNIRKAWGNLRKISEAIDIVFSRIKIEESADQLFLQKKENNSNTIADKIRELGKLRDEGLIDSIEFDNKKKDFLEQM